MADKKTSPKTKLSEMEQRRAALKKELEKIEGELEDSLDNIKEDVSSRLEPKYWIKKYPFESLGISVLLGFIAGNLGKGKDGRPVENESVHSLKENFLWSELKRAMTRKAVQKLIDVIDSKLEEGKQDR